MLHSQIGRVKLTLMRSVNLGLSTSDLARYSNSTDEFVAPLPSSCRICFLMCAALRRRITPSRYWQPSAWSFDMRGRLTVSGIMIKRGNAAPKMMICIHCIQRHCRSGLASTQDMATGARPRSRQRRSRTIMARLTVPEHGAQCKHSHLDTSLLGLPDVC